MKVGLDATPLTVPTGGIARYTVELTRALARGFPADELLLLSDQSFELPGDLAPRVRVGARPQGFLGRRWWLFGLERELARHALDVFHGTDFSTPYLPRRPSLLMLHDLSPWMDPAWHSEADRVRRRTPWLIRLNRWTLMLTPSEAIRRQALAHFGLDPDRVIATPLAPASCFTPLRCDPPPARPYFLFAATLEPRKNLPLALEAWREVRRRHDVDLVIAGRARADAPLIPEEPGLHRLGPVSDERLAQLYSHCAAFLFPTLYEGFGLPVLEAMQCGAPVLASAIPAIQEQAGDAALLLDSADQAAWVEAMEAVLTRPELAGRLRDRSLARARAFSWDRTAGLTHQAYQEALTRYGR
jgi:glycosyltransferase involved in cell wall biosynthesis